MKPVIIIAIAFVLLIPIPIFASHDPVQEHVDIIVGETRKIKF